MPKYNSYDTIPAKVFFDILETKNYQLLKPKPSEGGLEEIFVSIYDKFFVESDNYDAKQYLQLTKDISFLEFKIATIKQVLHYLYYTDFSLIPPDVFEKMRLEILKSLEVGCEIYIDVKENFTTEVQRILQQECGIIENDLTLANLEFENIKKNRNEKVFNFYESVTSLSNVHNRNIDEKLILPMYVEADKSAQRIIKQQKQK